MKLRNILFVLLAIFITLFGVSVKAETTAPNSYTIAAKDLRFLYGKNYLGSGTIQFRYKQTTDGKVVYCTEIHDLMPTSGTEVYKLNKELDARFVYVLENGYPNKSITGNNDEDYFITALAVWYLVSPNDSVFTNFNFTNGTYHGSSSTVAKEISKLVNNSKKYVRYEPTIKIKNPSSDLTLSSDKKYYVSSALTVTTSGNITNNTFKVSLDSAPSGTIVTDKSGTSRSVYGVAEAFYVKVPVSSVTNSAEVKISTSASGTMGRAYLYSPTSNSAYQSTTTLYPEKYNVKDSTNFKVTVKKETPTNVEIIKIDSTTGKALKGAKLTLKNASGEVIETWETTEEAKVFKGLPLGKYYITEEYAPDGYILSSETVEFELSSTNKSVKLSFKNTKEDVKDIYISKQDVTNKKELPGAHLELYDEDGNLVEAWISGKEPHKIKGLKPGKYSLKETLAPEGYELTSETVEFVVKEDGTVDGKIVMYNKPETYIPMENTSSFKTITASLIGIVIIGLGSMIIYKNYKKNEEN